MHLTFDLNYNPNTTSRLGYPEIIPYTYSLNTVGLFVFELCMLRTNKQKTPNALPTLTDRVSMWVMTD